MTDRKRGPVAKLVESCSKKDVRNVRAFEEERCLSILQATQLEGTLDELIESSCRIGILNRPDAWRQLRDAYAIRTMLRTGLRRFEFCKTRCGDVDLEAESLRVVGKGNLQDYVPLPGAAVRTLREWLAAKDQVGESTAPRAFLFQGPDKGPISFSNLRLRWIEVLKVAGLHKPFKRKDKQGSYGLHTLRHTAGLLVYAQTGDLAKTARFLRHTSIKTTAQFYLHVDSDALRKELDEVGVWK